MSTIILSIFLVLGTIFLVPILVYGLASAVAGLKTPEGASPGRFLISVLVSKIGTAVTFVLLFHVARGSLNGQWLLYAFLWWIMFVLGEVGQAIGPNYTWKEAVAGVLSETLYLPISAWLTHWLIGLN